jgi:hypothetical protein
MFIIIVQYEFCGMQLYMAHIHFFSLRIIAGAVEHTELILVYKLHLISLLVFVYLAPSLLVIIL